MLAGFSVDFPNSSATFLLVNAGFSNVTVGAHRDIEFGAIRAGNDILGPVAIEGARRAAVAGLVRGVGFAALAHNVGPRALRAVRGPQTNIVP